MSLERPRAWFGVVLALLLLPGLAAATVSVSPTISYNGAYTVSWTDSSGGLTRAYLAESLNGGAWTKKTVTGTSSLAFTGKAVGSYAYKIQIYLYDMEVKKELFEYETNVATVQVTKSAPGVPGALSGPTQSELGAYTLAWGPASGVVTRYELQENGALAYSGTSLTANITGKTNGNYTYQVRACNGIGCSTFTASWVVKVSLSLTALVPDAPLTPPVVPAQEWVGTLPGSPSVSGGSASYELPIEVPPGRAGMAPRLGLSYSSRSGNGIAGVGWSLAGVSTIYRCPRTIRQEGAGRPVMHDGLDRLCMGGKRLVAQSGDATYGLSGSVYRTEVDSYDQVTLRNASTALWSSAFEVKHKDGRTSHFAAMSPAAPGTNPPDTWYLVDDSDPQGNCIGYRYARSPVNLHTDGRDAEWVLSSIAYTGRMTSGQCVTASSDRAVVFGYSDRPDHRTTFSTGVASTVTARLATITTYAGSQAVRTYQLAYTSSPATQRSLLTSITLCAGASCGTAQLPSTTFTYQASTPRFGTELLRPGQDIRRLYLGDYDGDGTPDWIDVDNVTPTPTAPTRSSITLSCFGQPTLIQTESLNLPPALVDPDTAPIQYFGLDPVDLNFDGRIDVTNVSQNGHAAFLSLACSRGAVSSSVTEIPGLSASQPIYYGDYTGDGIVDAVMQDGAHAGSYSLASGQLSFSSQATVPPPPAGPPANGWTYNIVRDFNGDGRQDVFTDATNDPSFTPTISFLGSQGTYVTWKVEDLFGPAGIFGPFRRWIDVNGDGLPDIYSPGDGIYINRGGAPVPGMFQKVALSTALVPSTATLFDAHRVKVVFAMDYDLDGLEELMVPRDRVLDYCGSKPYQRQGNGDPYAWCGNAFDDPGADTSLDKSVFVWDAYKFLEQADGSYQMVLVPTNLQAPVRYPGVAITDTVGRGAKDVVYRLFPTTLVSGGTTVFLGYYQYAAPPDPLSQGDGIYRARNLTDAPDLLVRVTNGVGATASWTHQPLSARSVPTACGPASGPAFYVPHYNSSPSHGYVFFTSSMWAVSEFQVSNGLASGGASDTNRTCYRYEDAMLDELGRGFQGFKKIIAEERLAPAVGENSTAALSPNNLRTTTLFSQEFPLTNTVLRVTVENVVSGAPHDVALSDTSYWWNAQSTGTPNVSFVYQVAAEARTFDPASNVQVNVDDQSVMTLHNLNDSAISRSVTANDQVDVVAGEVTSSCILSTDVATAPPVNTISWDLRSFTDDTVNFWVGRLDSEKRTTDFLSGTPPDALGSSGPNPCPVRPLSASGKTQTTYNGWFGLTSAFPRKLLSQQLATSTVANEVTTTYDYAPPYGNLLTRTVTARAVLDGLRTTYGSSADGYFIETEQNPAGHVATTVHDPTTGKPISAQVVQNGPVTHFAYDGLGRVLSTTTDGSQPVYERLVAWTGSACVPNGSASVCSRGALSRQVLQAGAPTHTEYMDILGRVVETDTTAFGGQNVVVTKVGYNERGLKLAESAPRLNGGTAYWTTYSGFDALGRTGRKTVNRDTALFSTGQGNSIAITDYVYGGTSQTGALEAFKTKIYAYKQAAGTSPSPGTPGSPAIQMSRTYDSRKRLVQTTQLDNRTTPGPITTTYRYDPAGGLTNIIDSAGNSITAAYDDLGRKTKVTDPDRGMWTYDWDGLSRLKSQVDARKVSLLMKYDNIGRPLYRFTTGSNGTQILDAAWTYDQGGQYGVLNQVQGVPDGYIRTYQYDSLLRPYRVVTTVKADDVVMPASSGQTRTFVSEYGYDNNFGRLKAKRLPSYNLPAGETFSLDYDAQGFLVGETQLNPDLSRGQRYRLVKGMSPRGQVTDQEFGNCTTEYTQYDASAGMATFLTALRPSAAASPCPMATQLVRQVDYAHDHFLNLQQQVKNIAGVQTTEVFTYDELQRLESAGRSWGTTPPGYSQGYTEGVSYAYDDLGNLSAKSDYGAPYVYGVRPHAVISVGTLATFDYDDNGNMVSGDGRTIDFNLLDRPVGVTQSGTTTEFAYAPDGARYRQRIWANPGIPVDPRFGPKTVYHVDKDYELTVWAPGPGRPVAVTEERTYLGGSVVAYRKDSGVREVRYQHVDRLGSVDAVTDANGQKLALDLHGYDPFGRPRGEAWTPSQDRLHKDGDLGATTDRGFTGHEHLDLHYLIHMNGRVYDYRLGRFLSVDPIISDPANSQSINPYSYIGNNPLSGTDPTGYQCVRLTGTHICNTVPIGNLTINGSPIPGNVGSGPATQRTSGAEKQGAMSATAAASSKGGPGEVARQGPKLLSWDFAAGLVFGGYQQAMPGGFLLGSPAADNPSFELGRSFSLGAGSIVQGFEAGKLIAGGLTLAGAAAVTGPGEAVAAPAGGALVLSGVAVGVQAVGNGVEAVRAFSNAMEMRGSGNGGNGDPVTLPDNRAPHIFRDAPGHMSDTPANRQMLTNVANDPGARLGTDRFGNTWAARMNADGTQTWVQIRNGQITNGGVNQMPRTFHPDTGLSGPPTGR